MEAVASGAFPVLPEIQAKQQWNIPELKSGLPIPFITRSQSL